MMKRRVIMLKRILKWWAFDYERERARLLLQHRALLDSYEFDKPEDWEMR